MYAHSLACALGCSRLLRISKNARQTDKQKKDQPYKIKAKQSRAHARQCVVCFWKAVVCQLLFAHSILVEESTRKSAYNAFIVFNIKKNRSDCECESSTKESASFSGFDVVYFEFLFDKYGLVVFSLFVSFRRFYVGIWIVHTDFLGSVSLLFHPLSSCSTKPVLYLSSFPFIDYFLFDVCCAGFNFLI